MLRVHTSKDHMPWRLAWQDNDIIILLSFFKELLCFLFREAKIHNAVLFFDECETLFETRENRPNQTLGVLLTEVCRDHFFLTSVLFCVLPSTQGTGN